MSGFRVLVSLMCLALIGITGGSEKFNFEDNAPFVKWEKVIPNYPDLLASYNTYKKLSPNEKTALTKMQDPEWSMTVPQMIEHLQYKVETHYVTTKDGYILGLHRIPFGRNSTKSGMPVILQHGLVCSSADFVNNLANESMGFILADNGYDVWLGNSRGNAYSTNHTTLNTASNKFWDFSYDQMGMYDLPANIDYILKTTGKKQLYYIGHSMGTTEAFAFLSTTHAYDKKIKQFIALGPIAALTHLNSVPLAILSPNADQLMAAFAAAKVYSVLENYDFIKFFAETACANHSTNVICVGILESFFGKELPTFNKTRLPIYLTHTPAGTSMRTIVHYGQSHNTNTFRGFNKGFSGNIKSYRWPFPPKYDISKIKVPIALIYGTADILAVPADVKVLESKLGNVKTFEVPGYNHMDLIWDTSSELPVVKRILSLLNATD